MLLERIGMLRQPKSQRGKARQQVINDGDDNEDYAQVPTSWVRCYVADIASVGLGGTPSRKVPANWDGSIPWVSSGEVSNCRIGKTRERITPAGLRNSNAKLYPPGTVLIAMIGEGKTRGQAAILDIEACTNQNAAALVFDSGHVNPEYVWYWALGEYDRTRAIGRGGNQPALNGQKVRGLRLPFPPLEEQHEIVRGVRALLALAGTIEMRIEASRANAEALGQSILAKAFRGELVPTEAELAAKEGREYETAEALLARVQTARGQDGHGATTKRRRRAR